MSPNYRIRPATLSDAPSLATLLYQLNYFTALKDLSAAEIANIVMPALKTAVIGDAHTMLVAAGQDNQILGYCSIHWIPGLYLQGPEGYLSELFVDEATRGRGIGGALLEAATDEARQRGSTKLQLINFRERESYSRGFYAKHGWEERPSAANFALYLTE